MKKRDLIQLSDEQRLFLDKALTGENILVDACIGSGKTTAIQYLCCEYPETTQILYLTYNKLLKLDAKEKWDVARWHLACGTIVRWPQNKQDEKEVTNTENVDKE